MIGTEKKQSQSKCAGLNEVKNMKKDCSKTEVFLSEWKRMCNSYDKTCSGCPLYLKEICGNGDSLTSVLNKLVPFIEVVQNWSDEHPELTMAEKFFEMFPNAEKDPDGTPQVCPHQIGWCKEICGYGSNIQRCVICWSRPYKKEVEE